MAHRRRRPLAVIAAAVVAAGLGIAGVTSAFAAAGAPITGIGGKCLDVTSGSSANGARVQLWTCNGGAAQQWSAEADGSIRALGKCLDVAAAGTANGAKVQ